MPRSKSTRFMVRQPFHTFRPAQRALATQETTRFTPSLRPEHSRAAYSRSMAGGGKRLQWHPPPPNMTAIPHTKTQKQKRRPSQARADHENEGDTSTLSVRARRSSWPPLQTPDAHTHDGSACSREIEEATPPLGTRVSFKAFKALDICHHIVPGVP